MHEIKVLGIDLGKDICSVVGLAEAGQVLLRRRMRRDIEAFNACLKFREEGVQESRGDSDGSAASASVGPSGPALSRAPASILPL